MFRNKLTYGLIAPVLALAFVAGCSDDNDNNPLMSGPTAQTSVRVIHTSYDAPAVDVRVDGAVAISNLGYGASSGYASLNAGSRSIQVTPAGQSQPVVIDANLTLEDAAEYTVYAVDALGSIDAVVSVDDRTPDASVAKVRFLHASPDAPNVDIRLDSGDGPAVFSNAAFKAISNYATVPAGSYTFAVTPAGTSTEVLIYEPIGVSAGGVYTVVAHGTLDGSDDYPFAVRVFIDNANGDGYADLRAATSQVMVVHASPDAPGVDLLVDGQKVNSAALGFPQNTGYLGVPSGDRNVKVNAAGTSVSVIDAGLNLDPQVAYSVFAVDFLMDIKPLVLMDNLATPASGKAHVRFVHLSPDAPAVDITLTDGTVVWGNKGFMEYADFTPLDAGTYDLQVRPAGQSAVVLDLPGIQLTSGKIYTVFAKGSLSSLGAEIIINN